MKYLLLIGVLLLTGCAESKLWLVGWDEARVTRNCERMKATNVERCVQQNKDLALTASAPVVFTVPLVK